ncbi:hypothetical protein LCGC14_1153750 [marine sediment metagenome]|uniref:Uncharacterized protein n=1 Tax=marine sediment metagenome TaxID=412755 RepID=A0A0F9Q092_9ZZZZ
MKQKFTDKELIELHKSGLSDTKISKIFKCSLPSVNKRRYKLGLVANFKNYRGERNTKEQCLNNTMEIKEKRKILIKKQYPTKEFKEKERKRNARRRETKEYQEYQRNYRFRNKFVNGMLSAMDDVKNGRYTLLQSGKNDT